MNWIKLGDIFKITSGGTPKSGTREYYDNGTIPWVKTGDLKVRHLTSVPGNITEAGLQNSSAKIFPLDTVLIAMYGATIGACSILKIEASTNQACAALLPNENVDPEFLYFYLISIQNQLIRKGVGGGQPNISGSILKETPFPLFPIEVQRQIVHILSQAESIVLARQDTLVGLDDLLKSTFYSFFGDPIKNEKGWRRKNLGDIANIVSGVTKNAKQAIKDPVEVPYMRVANVQDGRLDLKEIKTVEVSTRCIVPR